MRSATTVFAIIDTNVVVAGLLSAQPTSPVAQILDSMLGACRTWGVDGENRPQRGRFLPDLQPHSPATGQKGGEKCTAAVGLQPTLPKSDKLLGATLPFVLSPELLAEYRSVLLRPKIVARHRLAPTEVDAILTDIAHHSIVLDPGPTPAHRQLAPDPSDQLLWDLLTLRPDLVLVTGDQRLLSSEYMASRVLTPAAWLGRQPH